jgi:hypothetical protein
VIETLVAVYESSEGSSACRYYYGNKVRQNIVLLKTLDHWNSVEKRFYAT